MVKHLTQHENLLIAQAVEQAEKRTSAEIVIVVTPASGLHADFMLLYGVMAGFLITLGLYMTQIVTYYPELLLMQFGVMAALFLLPALRKLCWRLIPNPTLHERTAGRALREYHLVWSQHPCNTPIVLLFVSLGERFAHIIASNTVVEKIPDNHWDATIAHFIKILKSSGISSACCEAVGRMAEVLSKDFPPDGRGNLVSNAVIERD